MRAFSIGMPIFAWPYLLALLILGRCGEKLRLGTGFLVAEGEFGKKFRLGVARAGKSTPNRKNLPKQVHFAPKTVPNRLFLPGGWIPDGFVVSSIRRRPLRFRRLWPA